jgi:hypothetical protein
VFPDAHDALLSYRRVAGAQPPFGEPAEGEAAPSEAERHSFVRAHVTNKMMEMVKSTVNAFVMLCLLLVEVMI